MKKKPVLIEWEDASSTSGWHKPDEIQRELKSPVIVSDVCWVVGEDKRTLIIASRYCKEEKYGDYNFVRRIPKSLIRKRRRI